MNTDPTSSTAPPLLMAIYGFLPATDDRMRATIEAIARELTDDGLVLPGQLPAGLQPHRADHCRL
jgi:GH15 family glucan-1,4-alpha-glucosidase